MEGNKEGNRKTLPLGNRETADLKIRGKQGNRRTAMYSHNWRKTGKHEFS